MATPIWLEGWEHGVLSTSGAGIVNSITGTVGTNIAVTADAKRTGNYGLRVYPSTSTAVHATRNIPAGNRCIVGRFYFKLPATLPTADHVIVRQMTAVQQLIFSYNYNSGSPRFAMIVNASTPQYFSGVAADTWYRLDWRFDASTGTSTIDWQIDGVAQTQCTRTVAAADIIGCNLGITTAAVGNIYYDDVILSATSGDYPLGAGEIVGLYPSGAGTSNLDTNIEDDGSVDVNDSSNPANVELDEDPLGSGTDYIKQIGGTSALYAAVAFADTTESTIVGASAFEAYTSGAASANSASARIYDEDGTETAIFTGDMSETTTFYKSVILPAPSGGWDQSAVNALQGRVGYATDYSPIPYFQGLMIQVAYVASTAIALVTDEGSQVQAGDEATLGVTMDLAPDSAGYQEQAGDEAFLGVTIDLVADGTGYHSQLGDEATLGVSSAVDLLTDEGVQTQLGDEATIQSIVDMAPDLTGYQAQVGDEATLGVTIDLAPDSTGFQTQLGDEATIEVGVIQLIADEGSQVQSGDEATIESIVDLLPDGTGAQVQAGDEATLELVAVNLIADEGYQLQAGDEAVLGVIVDLVADGTGAQTQFGDEVTVEVGVIALVPAEGSQDQAGDEATLGVTITLAPAEGTQEQAGDEATLEVPAIELVPAEGVQTQAGDEAALTQVHNIEAQDGSQDQAGDEATVNIGLALVTDEGSQDQVGDGPSLIVGILTKYEFVDRLLLEDRIAKIRRVKKLVERVKVHDRKKEVFLRRTQ